MASVRASTLRRLAKACFHFVATLVSALLAAIGAWPTPGLFRDDEPRHPDQSADRADP